jgi:hypothetical protein
MILLLRGVFGAAEKEVYRLIFICLFQLPGKVSMGLALFCRKVFRAAPITRPGSHWLKKKKAPRLHGGPFAYTKGAN